jgi:hypothetical protein
VTAPLPATQDPVSTLERRFWLGLSGHGVHPQSRLLWFAAGAAVVLTSTLAIGQALFHRVTKEGEGRRYYREASGKRLDHYLSEVAAIRTAFAKILEVNDFSESDIPRIKDQITNLGPHVERLNRLQAEIGDSIWSVRAKLAQIQTTSGTQIAVRDALCDFRRVHWQILVLKMNTKVARPMLDIYISRDVKDQIARLEKARREWNALEMTLPAALESLRAHNRQLD